MTMRHPTTDTVRRGRTRSAGFSLIEALVAASFFGVALLAFNQSTLVVTRATKGADSSAAATSLAQETLELMRSLPLEHAWHTPGTYNDPDNPITADGQAGGRFTRTWQVSNRDIPDFGLKTVIVTIAWNDPQPRTMQLGGFVRCAEVPCP